MNVQSFASGTNRPSEIRGFLRLGMPVGVSVDKLNEEAIQLLSRSEQPVFVDSGAFSEVVFEPGSPPRVVKPISTSEWRKRLAVYQRLGEALGQRAMVVAPDMVGSQRETLARLGQFRRQLQKLATTGAVILIPLQCGRLSHVEFYHLAKQTAGVALAPAMPMKKAATTTEDVVEFLKEIQPGRLHFLGMGMRKAEASGLLNLVRFHSPFTNVTLDSNRIRAYAGYGRPLTDAEVAFRGSDIEGVYGAISSPVFDTTGMGLDYTDSIALPASWASVLVLGTVADEAMLSEGERNRFMADPDRFLESDWIEEGVAWHENPLLALALDRAWEQYVRQTVRSAVRTAAIVETFRQAA